MKAYLLIFMLIVGLLGGCSKTHGGYNQSSHVQADYFEASTPASLVDAKAPSGWYFSESFHKHGRLRVVDGLVVTELPPIRLNYDVVDAGEQSSYNLPVIGKTATYGPAMSKHTVAVANAIKATNSGGG